MMMDQLNSVKSKTVYLKWKMIIEWNTVQTMVLSIVITCSNVSIVIYVGIVMTFKNLLLKSLLISIPTMMEPSIQKIILMKNIIMI